MSIFSNRKEVIKEIDDSVWEDVFKNLHKVKLDKKFIRYNCKFPNEFLFNTRDFQLDEIIITIRYPDINTQRVAVSIFFKDNDIPCWDSQLWHKYDMGPDLTEEQLIEYIITNIKSNFNIIIDKYRSWRQEYPLGYRPCRQEYPLGDDLIKIPD